MWDTYVVTRDEMWNDHNYHVCTSYLVNGIQIQFDAFRFVSLPNVSKEIGENSFPTFSQVVKGFSGIAISRKFLPWGYTPFAFNSFTRPKKQMKSFSIRSATRFSPTATSQQAEMSSTVVIYECKWCYFKWTVFMMMPLCRVMCTRIGDVWCVQTALSAYILHQHNRHTLMV